MKKSLSFLLLIMILFYSCNSDDDISIVVEENNNSQIEELDNLLISIQEDLPEFVENVSNISSSLTRINYMFGGGPSGGEFGTYLESFDSESNWNNEIWRIAYSNMFPEIEEAISIAEEQGFAKHLGIAKIIESYLIMTLADMYGDIIYFQTDGTQIIIEDSNAYAIAQALLDKAILNLTEAGEVLEVDYYYYNDFENWIKLANTLKMSGYLNTRLVDNTAIDKFNEIIDSNNYLNAESQDFEFRYGTGSSDYLAKHPIYINSYTAAGVGNYRSNWLMDRMQKDNDPRIRYYFYRQTPCIHGNLGIDGELCDDPFGYPSILCLPEEKPNHYTEEMAFCSLENGYWGRDHGLHLGIPPDSFRRTAVGVYPAAGAFDDDRFSLVDIVPGGLGTGITPILLSSWVDFMRAEMALAQNNTSEANSFLTEGLQKSISKITSFGSLDPEADTSYYPSGTHISNFIAAISESFTNASMNDKWDIFARQQVVAHYGNGLDSYNMYRRTGYPYTLQYFRNPNTGPFIRSLLYPNIALENELITQKPNAEVQVFWDTNNAYPFFPYSN